MGWPEALVLLGFMGMIVVMILVLAYMEKI